MRSLPALFVLSVLSASVFAAPSPAQAPAGAQAGANQDLPNKGKVLSTVAAGMYTYIELSSGGKDTTWIAVTAMPVKKGDMLAYDGGATMTNFYSKTLNRTFPQVIFVGKAVVTK